MVANWSCNEFLKVPCCKKQRADSLNLFESPPSLSRGHSSSFASRACCRKLLYILITHIQEEHGICIRIATCGVRGDEGQEKKKLSIIKRSKRAEQPVARPEVYDQCGMMRHPGEEQRQR
jgi:hypothetical protein